MGNIYGDFERDQLNKMKINATLKAFALVLRKRMFRDKTEEEQEFIKLSKYINPITLVQKQRVSSVRIKRIWIELQALMKESKNFNEKLSKVKSDFYIQSIADRMLEI